MFGSLGISPEEQQASSVIFSALFVLARRRMEALRSVSIARDASLRLTLSAM